MFRFGTKKLFMRMKLASSSNSSLGNRRCRRLCERPPFIQLLEIRFVVVVLETFLQRTFLSIFVAKCTNIFNFCLFLFLLNFNFYKNTFWRQNIFVGITFSDE